MNDEKHVLKLAESDAARTGLERELSAARAEIDRLRGLAEHAATDALGQEGVKIMRESLSAARAELATAREHESAALSGQRQLLACHDGALRQLEEARAMFATAMRLWRNRYLPWTDAGGVDECKHGFGSGIPCGPCDDEAVRQYERKAAGMDATAGEVKA